MESLLNLQKQFLTIHDRVSGIAYKFWQLYLFTSISQLHICVWIQSTTPPQMKSIGSALINSQAFGSPDSPLHRIIFKVSKCKLHTMTWFDLIWFHFIFREEHYQKAPTKMNISHGWVDIFTLCVHLGGQWLSPNREI